MKTEKVNRFIYLGILIIRECGGLDKMREWIVKDNKRAMGLNSFPEIHVYPLFSNVNVKYEHMF